jgi:enoyl-CoA hydratase
MPPSKGSKWRSTQPDIRDRSWYTDGGEPVRELLRDRRKVALHGLLDLIAAIPVPVIVAVHGAALGAGTQLAIAADLRVVDASARFAITAARLGLMIDHWTVQRLALLAGQGPARAMLLAAEELGAERALQLGFAQRSGDLSVAQAWAEELAGLAPLSVAGHKLLLSRMEFSGSADAAGAEAYARVKSSFDALEGINAFWERRAPQFQGR